MLNQLVMVMIGGSLGAGARWLMVSAVQRLWPVAFPWGTFLVNCLGCFIMGLATVYFASRNHESAETLRLFLATGVLGGFTTFSAFSLDAYQLWQRGEVLAAGGYVLGSVFVSIAALLCGISMAKAWGVAG